MHFEPLTIFSEFSDIKEYRNLVDNKDRKIKGLELHIQDLKTISDNYETKIASNETIVLYIKQLENIGINTFDIKTLEWVFSEISKKNGLTKKEIKFRFFRYLERLHTLLTLEQDIFEKTNKLSILDSEIYSRRKIIEESQPIVFSILQNLLNAGLNENDILMAFKIFTTDLCNNMPFSNRTYLEQLSKDLEKFKTVRDTLKGLNSKILLEKSYIGKLAIVKSNLEAFLFSIGITTIYFYSILLNTQIQIQKKLTNLLICYIRYFPIFCVIIRDPNKSAKSKSKIEENNNNNNNNKKSEARKLKRKKLQRQK